MNPDDYRWSIRCLVCGGRGGWWSDESRVPCQRCAGTGYQTVSESTALLALAVQDYDGFTPNEAAP